MPPAPTPLTGSPTGTVTTTLTQRRRVVSGAGAVDRLPAALDQAGIDRALVVCGKHLAAGPALGRVLKALGDRAAGIFDECTPHARIETVDRIAAALRGVDADGIVAVGGGSTIDAAKGAAVLAGVGGDLADMATRFEPPDRYVVPPLAGPRVPVVAVPTTLSASDATISAGFIDLAQRSKIVIVDPEAPVRAVVLDPGLLATTPRDVLAGSAGNAINHGVEALYSRGRTPFTDVFASTALTLLVASIEDALDGDEEALGHCQTAAHLAGMALPGGGLGLAHAACHALGAFGCSHGGANSVMVVHALRFNREWLGPQERVIEQALGAPAGESVTALTELLTRIGAPTSLRTLGMDKDDLPVVAAHAFGDRHVHANPRPVRSAVEVEQLLWEAW